MKNYLLIDFTIDPVEGRDILLAMLDVSGYDSFEETEGGLKAYILEQDWDEEAMRQLPLFSSSEFKISYTVGKLEDKNWNEEWETNYDPIYIEDQIHIRAPFHAEENFPIQLLIEPKMSFGTGHHQTTRLMSMMLLKMDVSNKKLLDMGTGTGVLAILAEKLGATDILAIDNFDWAVENTIENAERNGCSAIKALLGEAPALEGLNFDVVLANINRNVLLEDMKSYVRTLQSGGELVISGFFEDDFELLNEQATSLGLEMVNKLNEDRWCCCHYTLK